MQWKKVGGDKQGTEHTEAVGVHRLVGKSGVICAGGPGKVTRNVPPPPPARIQVERLPEFQSKRRDNAARMCDLCFLALAVTRSTWHVPMWDASSNGRIIDDGKNQRTADSAGTAGR